MPKETVQYPSTNYRAGTEISVHWSKQPAEYLPESGCVQLQVTRHVWSAKVEEPDPNALCGGHPVHGNHSECVPCVTAAEENRVLKESGVPEGAMSVGGMPFFLNDFDPPATVFTELMTRDDINRMISVLRRARDQAYGVDA